MIGKEILNYRIVSLLGKGGMGSVYVAEHTLIKNEKVAIKVINANMANEFTRTLLRDEAEHLAGLNHPNIVAFKNYHIDKQGNIYLIMEYADGKNLEDFINKVNGLVVEDRICPLFEPILDAVGYAHKKHILHCDIKPANIVITTEGIPKILDFGIAKIIKNVGEDEGDNVIMGTPSYMSPEQVKGEHLDERSDIYSLGVLLHHVMTGNPPYDTTTLTEQQINTKVVEEPLPRMRTYYKYVSDKIQKIVDKATAKNPNDRYNSCEEFKKALHDAVYPPKMPNWAKIAAASVLVLLIGCGWYAWDYNRIKTYYYKDYVEKWGVPEGIGEVSESEHGRMSRTYRFVYQKRKLLSVSHVNSYDNIIDDGESERNERPVDQSFSYNADGKVSRVVVKNRSGRVLYVKSYNEKLNTMAFQYDDEHGTERVISNSTVGYTRALEDESSKDRGKISRWWLEYDDNGYVSSVKYAGLDNSPVGDENGIYGRTYVRDEKGRPLEIQYIGIDGKPQPTRWGLGIKKFHYNEDDYLVKVEYLTIDRKPAFDDADGISIYVMEYDENNNLEYALHQGPDGKLFIPKKNNVAGTHNIYDDNGLLVTQEALGVDRKPMLIKGLGAAIIKKEYDDNGYASKISYFDTKGNPINCSDGNSYLTIKNDEHGNPLEVWYYNVKNKLCVIRDGEAGCKMEYDSIGNTTKTVFYGVDKMPYLMKDQTAGWTQTFDDKSRVVSRTSLGLDLKPCADNNNVICVKVDYDKRGNTTKVAYFDATGKTLRLNNEGIAGWKDSYDDSGNHMERDFFGTDGKPVMPSELQYACVKYTYDENGNLSGDRYYNLSGDLTLVDGVAGDIYVKDKRGNTIEHTPIGVNEQLANGRLKSKYKYDRYDNCIEQSLWDASGAALNRFDIHIYKYKYNTRNDLVEESYFGKNGQLTLNSSTNVAIARKEYNDRGEMIKQAYYGTDEKPCVCLEGWSNSTYEYDDYGNVVKQCFFGVDGKPCDPQKMPPVGLAKYDKWGNIIYIAAQDGYGKFIINPSKGWAICRMKYDNNGNKLEESYYNVSDKPMSCPEGYHKVISVYDKNNHEIEKSYFGENGKPSLLYNYHKIKYSYVGGTDNVKTMELYGINGQKVNCNAGWQKNEYTYNEDFSLKTMIKYYRADGSVLAVQKWTGSEFVLVEQGFDWKAHVPVLLKEFPLNFGDDCLGLVGRSIKITGDNACEVRFSFAYTTTQIDSEQFDQLKNVVNGIVDIVERELKHKPYVTGNLYDKNGTKVYTYRK